MSQPTPPGVIACGPDGRLTHLPPEDVATLRAFADLLTDGHPARYCPKCHRIAVQPDQHQCPTSTKEKR